MDKAAKCFLRFYTLQDTARVHISPILYKEKWSISVDKIKLTHIERKNLYTKVYGRRTLKYWNKKNSVPMNSKQID